MLDTTPITRLDPSKEGLHRTRMEHDSEGYYSVHGYHLHVGLRTAIGADG